MHEEEVDGPTLLGYSRSSLKNDLDLPAGRVTKLLRAIQSLRENAGETDTGELSDVGSSAKSATPVVRHDHDVDGNTSRSQKLLLHGSSESTVQGSGGMQAFERRSIKVVNRVDAAKSNGVKRNGGREVEAIT